MFAPPGEPPVSGDRLGAWLDGFPAIKAFTVDFERVDVGGDLATATGRGSMTLEVNGNKVVAPLKFADVFRREADGQCATHT